MKMTRNTVMVFYVIAACCLTTTLAKAQLLGVNPSYPEINFVNTDVSAVSYDPLTQLFSVNATPTSIFLSEQDTGSLIVSNNILQIQLDTDGNMVSGSGGFLLAGQFTEIVNGETNVYSGTLLQGNVVGFGYQYSGTVNQFDFSVQLTGGVIASLFNCANLFGITMTSEESSFTGSFMTNFTGGAKGICGPWDTIPPVITCPLPSSVVTTPGTDPNNGLPGFTITYPNPTVTDNCDPYPGVFEDTPSGSFVDGNPGNQFTVNCYGYDVSGNVSTCSFTVTLGSSGVCSLGFTNGGLCPPVTLPTDLNRCSATYAFSLPLATNCNGQVFVATATAVTESGTTIPLTVLSNGLVQGVFPRTFTANGNVITFTATDGQGNNAVEQCNVFVKDEQAPTIVCMNQTATFNPIVTNALSCITAGFNSACITQSNYLWFTSVIRPTWCLNQNSFTVHVFDQTIQLQVDCTNITLNVPDAYVIFSNGIAMATTIFTNGEWITYSSPNSRGNTFVSGLAWQVPFNLNNLVGKSWGRDGDEGDDFRRHVSSATWCARFAVNTPGVALQWQWGAVVEKTLQTNYNLCGIKPVDDNGWSCWKNNDPAGSCENYKSYLVRGACGQGRDHDDQADCAGILSQPEPVNLGKGIICEGPVYFNTPMAADNCDDSVQVTCNPPSGSIFGPGNQTITCTAVDSSGNTNQCTFTLTVLAPLQVVFNSPACDNVDDNTANWDSGYNDMNCPDDPSTPEYVTCFHVGDLVPHVCRLLDCNGNDVTATLASCVTVHIDVTERSGSYTNSVLVSDLTQSGTGTPGCIMVPCNGTFQYTLNTAGYPAGTVSTSTFFRACVWVDYNSSPGVPVGMEDVLLQSQ